jgi:hypothetical protein
MAISQIMKQTNAFKSSNGSHCRDSLIRHTLSNGIEANKQNY